MKSQDEKLLILYKYLQTNEFSRDEVAKELSITPRQLTRLIKQWQEDGHIEYIKGVGRGNLSTFKFNFDVEQQYTKGILSQLDTYSVEEIQNILKLPLNESSKNLIKGLFNNTVNIDETIPQEESLIRNAITVDYIYRFPENLDPLQPMDTALDTLIYNTMDRLYEIDGDYFKSHLINYETVQDDNIMLYLFQDIIFSNGKQLLAQDIKNCLDRLLEHKWYGEFLSYIKSVEIIDLFVLKITYEGHVDKLKFDLASPYASIYLVEMEKYIGTNVYRVDKVTDNYIILVANQKNHHCLPEVKKVYLVNSYSNYEKFIINKINKTLCHNIYLKKITLINPYFTQLNVNERQQLLYFIKKFYQGIVDDEIEQRPITQTKIVMGIIDLTEHLPTPLFNYLKAQGFNISKHHLNYKETLSDDVINLPCDFLILSHTFSTVGFYYSLLNNTNIKYWLKQFDETQKFIDQVMHLPINSWHQAEDQYKKFLEDDAWYLENTVQQRKIIELKGFKNVVFNYDGVVLYGHIIVREH